MTRKTSPPHVFKTTKAHSLKITRLTADAPLAKHFKSQLPQAPGQTGLRIHMPEYKTHSRPSLHAQPAQKDTNRQRRSHRKTKKLLPIKKPIAATTHNLATTH